MDIWKWFWWRLKVRHALGTAGLYQQHVLVSTGLFAKPLNPRTLFLDLIMPSGLCVSIMVHLWLIVTGNNNGHTVKEFSLTTCQSILTQPSNSPQQIFTTDCNLSLVVTIISNVSNVINTAVTKCEYLFLKFLTLVKGYQVCNLILRSYWSVTYWIF